MAVQPPPAPPEHRTAPEERGFNVLSAITQRKASIAAINFNVDEAAADVVECRPASRVASASRSSSRSSSEMANVAVALCAEESNSPDRPGVGEDVSVGVSPCAASVVDMPIDPLPGMPAASSS